MKRHLKEATIIVIYNFFLIPVLAITGIFMWRGNFIDLIFAAAAFLHFIIILPAIYGRLAETALRRRKTYREILEEHWVNYTVVFLVTLLPVAVIVYFIGSSKYYVLHAISEVIVPATVNVLIIYVFPYVFMGNEGISAIPEGVRVLVKDIKYSIPLIILTVMIFIIKELVAVVVNSLHVKKMLTLIEITFMSNILTEFISLVVFVAAYKVLMERRGGGGKRLSNPP